MTFDPREPLAPVWLIIGDATPLVDDAVDRLIAVALERCGLPAFNHSTFRASDPGAVEAFSASRTLPMMADRRLVVLRDVQEASDEVFQALQDYAAAPSDTTVLLATGTGFPKARKGGKAWGSRIPRAVKKTGQVVKLTSRDVRPAQFVSAEAKRLGKSLGRSEARLMVELVGTDVGQLRQEVTKVALFVGDAPRITADDVHVACSQVAQAAIWDLTAGIATRDPDVALSSLHRQFEEGDDARKLLGMIAWQLRQLLQAAELIGMGAGEGEIRKVARLRGDVIRSLRDAVRSQTFPDAATVMERLADANREMNQHRGGDRHILEVLVLDLCGEGPLPRAARVRRVKR